MYTSHLHNIKQQQLLFIVKALQGRRLVAKG